MKVLVISDTQDPFSHPDYLPFLKAVSKKHKVDEIVHVGDEVDFHALSFFDPDPDGFSPGHELQAAIVNLKKLYKVFPTVKVCVSNHTARPLRKAFKYGLPKAFLKDYSEFLQAPKGWRWADYWEVDGIRYQHGEGYSGPQGALKAALTNMQSTVIGHIHAHAGVLYSANPKHLIFGMNVGCLINKDAYAFAYGKHIPSKPIISCGVVIDGLPLVIPMPMTAKGRWTGKL